jgi:hypothetical protein
VVIVTALWKAVDVKNVEEAAAGVPDRRHNLLQSRSAILFDDDAGVGRQVRAQIRIHAFGIGHRRRHAIVDQPLGEGTTLHQELDLERPGEHAVQSSDDQLVL